MLNFFKNYYHYFLAWLGDFIYRHPSEKLFVLGVTGTKGKSTTLELINAILEAAGKKTALLSSVRVKVGEKSELNKTGNTMPGRFFIQRFLRDAARAGCDFALVEVTSQGIVQNRHAFIDWNAAAFTNLRPEHLESHGSFENYREAKVNFFEYVAKKSNKSGKIFLINEDDAAKEYFRSGANGFGEIIYFSREIFVERELNNGGVSIGDWLASNFNLENAALATAFAKSQGVIWPVIQKALQDFKGVPGRMEVIQEKPFKVVVDYAHTPDSLEKVYESLKASELICVLGAAGGGRDKWKRPEMGAIAAKYCREIILTDEDPYDEKPSQILSEIKSGITNYQFPITNLYEILDRREAVQKAISLAQKGDTVIITGKGSESWIRLARGKKIPWSDRGVVEEILKNS